MSSLVAHLPVRLLKSMQPFLHAVLAVLLLGLEAVEPVHLHQQTPLVPADGSPSSAFHQ